MVRFVVLVAGSASVLRVSGHSSRVGYSHDLHLFLTWQIILIPVNPERGPPTRTFSFMPSTWEPDAFLSSVNKLRQIPYETLCLAPFRLHWRE